MSIHDLATAAAHLAAGRNKTDRPAPTGSSCRIVADFVAPGTISVVYHRTPVVTYFPDGRAALYAGGWFTRTTAERMRDYVARPAGLWVGVQKPDRHGRGDGITLTGREDGWPATEPRVRKCAKCRGTGEVLESWMATPQTCWRCKGAGMVDYGSKPIPVVFGTDPAFVAVLHPSGEITTGSWRDLIGTRYVPQYDCRCQMCQLGVSTWQELAYAY